MFHVEDDDQYCRLGCPDEPGCLSHKNRCLCLHDAFEKIRRKAGFRLRENQWVHDFITQTLLRSIQHGIVVMGIFDEIVDAHNFHQHNGNNAGRVGDSVEGRVRLMTAITPA